LAHWVDISSIVVQILIVYKDVLKLVDGGESHRGESYNGLVVDCSRGRGSESRD
jgi:hypothetical protein